MNNSELVFAHTSWTRGDTQIHLHRDRERHTQTHIRAPRTLTHTNTHTRTHTRCAHTHTVPTFPHSVSHPFLVLQQINTTQISSAVDDRKWNLFLGQCCHSSSLKGSRQRRKNLGHFQIAPCSVFHLLYPHF